MFTSRAHLVTLILLPSFESRICFLEETVGQAVRPGVVGTEIFGAVPAKISLAVPRTNGRDLADRLRHDNYILTSP